MERTMSSSEVAAPSPRQAAQDLELAGQSDPAVADVELAAIAGQEKIRVSSPGRDAWRRFRRNHAAIGSLGIILVLVIVATLAPFMHTMDPTALTSQLATGPSAGHWFGTNGLGQDIYSRVVFGLRVPLLVGFIGTL